MIERHNSYLTRGVVVAGSSLLALAALSACSPDAQNWNGITCFGWHDADYKTGTPIVSVAEGVVEKNPNVTKDDTPDIAMIIARTNNNQLLSYNSDTKQLVVSVGTLAVPTVCSR